MKKNNYINYKVFILLLSFYLRKIKIYLEKSINELNEEKISLLTNQYIQLDQTNHHYQQYHLNQFNTFKNKIKNIFSIENCLSFDDIAQSIIYYFNTNNNLQHELQSKQIDLTTIEEEERSIHTLTSVQSTPSLINEHDEELRQLKDKSYQLIQLDYFKNKFQNYLSYDENLSFDQIIQSILDNINKDRQQLEKDLHTS